MSIDWDYERSRCWTQPKAGEPTPPATPQTETLPQAASGRAKCVSDAEVIAAVRHELWQASDGRGYGDDRTLVGMVRRVIAQRDEARANRRGEFELRMEAEARLRAVSPPPASGDVENLLAEKDRQIETLTQALEPFADLQNWVSAQAPMGDTIHGFCGPQTPEPWEVARRALACATHPTPGEQA